MSKKKNDSNDHSDGIKALALGIFAICSFINAPYANAQWRAQAISQTVDYKEAPILREAAERRQQYQQLYHPVPMAGGLNCHQLPNGHWVEDHPYKPE